MGVKPLWVLLRFNDWSNYMEICYETSCVGIDMDHFDELMHNMKQYSYRTLIKLIQRDEPEMYHDLRLDLLNPWADQCGQTDTHFMLIHSGIEYFFKKMGNTTHDDDEISTKRVMIRYSFDVEYLVQANSDAHAEELVLSHCDLVMGDNLHSTLPVDQLDWNAEIHPEKEIIYD